MKFNALIWRKLVLLKDKPGMKFSTLIWRKLVLLKDEGIRIKISHCTFTIVGL